MSDLAIVCEVVVKDEPKSDNKNTQIRLYKKDKTFVDYLCEECIMYYLSASQLEKTLTHSNKNIRVITLKDLMMKKENRDVLMLLKPLFE